MDAYTDLISAALRAEPGRTPERVLRGLEAMAEKARKWDDSTEAIQKAIDEAGRRR